MFLREFIGGSVLSLFLFCGCESIHHVEYNVPSQPEGKISSLFAGKSLLIMPVEYDAELTSGHSQDVYDDTYRKNGKEFYFNDPDMYGKGKRITLCSEIRDMIKAHVVASKLFGKVLDGENIKEDYVLKCKVQSFLVSKERCGIAEGFQNPFLNLILAGLPYVFTLPVDSEEVYQTRIRVRIYDTRTASCICDTIVSDERVDESGFPSRGARDLVFEMANDSLQITVQKLVDLLWKEFKFIELNEVDD